MQRVLGLQHLPVVRQDKDIHEESLLIPWERVDKLGELLDELEARVERELAGAAGGTTPSGNMIGCDGS